jgi:uncharacterized membrane protein YcaP (DUF421 family)
MIQEATIMEILWRVAIVYIFIMFGLRMLGKREFGQLTPLELVTLLIVPEIVSQALVGEDFSMTNALVGVSTLFVLVYFSSLLQHKSEFIENMVSSSPTVLVHNGGYIGKHMDEERVSPGEIFNAMHESGLEQLEQVKWAILESDGKIAIIPQDSDENVFSPQQREKLTL